MPTAKGESQISPWGEGILVIAMVATLVKVGIKMRGWIAQSSVA